MSTENSRILIVALLTIQSSYINNTQEPAGDVPDTVQFWVEPEGASRIRTFATDHDIHIYSFPHPTDAGEAVIDAYLQNIQQHYSDLIASTHAVYFEDYTNEDDVIAQLAATELNGGLQVTESGIAFYNPDRGAYETQSKPR